ncbi:hypothetical protein R1flu_010577 [Riccia fluitans]|uniref:Uncharacterized protein n=1 Tax=Riccia fluitans TaxID=41844 RepID=A0ABD1Z5D3_9MARC
MDAWRSDRATSKPDTPTCGNRQSANVEGNRALPETAKILDVLRRIQPVGTESARTDIANGTYTRNDHTPVPSTSKRESTLSRKYPGLTTP